MSSFEDRVLERRRQFKKAVDGDDARRLRDDEAVQLRKQDKEVQLAKKRFANENMTNMPSVPSTQLPDLPTLVTAVRDYGDSRRQFQATQAIRKQLSIEKEPPIQLVIDTGVIPDFIHLLGIDNSDTQFEAAWALTNIASGTSQQTRVVMEHGAVPVFVRLLLVAATDEVKDQAVWALGNIAGDSAYCRDVVLSHGALEPVISICRTTDKSSMKRNATWALSNFCRGKPAPDLEVIRPALPTLASLAHSSDNDVLTDACWALSYFSEGNESQRIAAVLDTGILRRIVEIMNIQQSSIQIPALRLIGNTVTGDDNQTQAAIQAGALQALHPLIAHSKKTIRKEACWAISNITAGNHAQIQEVINAGFVPLLVSILTDDMVDVKKEACWAISNIASGGSVAQVQAIVNMGVIPPLMDALVLKDQKMIIVALDALHNVLKVGSTLKDQFGSAQNAYCVSIEQCGIEKIESLQMGHSDEIYQRVVAMLLFFDLEEDDGMIETAFEQPKEGFNFG